MSEISDRAQLLSECLVLPTELTHKILDLLIVHNERLEPEGQISRHLIDAQQTALMILDTNEVRAFLTTASTYLQSEAYMMLIIPISTMETITKAYSDWAKSHP